MPSDQSTEPGVDQGKEQSGAQGINRRQLLCKYGPYTAPVVISMLVPEVAYGHNTMQPYSTSMACVADAAGGFMHAANRAQHCMINGAPGGRNTHPVANPGPA